MIIRLAAVTAVFAIAGVIPFGTTPANAAPSDTGTTVAVSGPAEPVRLPAGGTATATLTIANGATTAQETRLRLATLTAGDDGRLRVEDSPDPQWTDWVSLPSAVTVPAITELPVLVTIRAPQDLPPDLYMLGVLIEPATPAAAGGVTINARITAVLSIDVPGARDRQLTTSVGRLPRFSIGTALHGTVDVRNVGAAGAMTRTQLRVDDSDGTNEAVLPVSGDALQLVPAGTKRTLNYTWKASGWLTVVRLRSEVSYSNGEQTLGNVTAQATPVILVAPKLLWTVAAALLAGAGIVGWWLLGRRRRPASVGRNVRNAKASVRHAAVRPRKLSAAR